MRAALLLLLLASACTASRAKPQRIVEGPMPIVTEDTVTYDVEGSTAKELRASLDKLGPLDDTGRHDAYTKYYVRWFYDYDRAETTCRVKNVRATVEVTYTFPNWPGETPELRERWQRYLEALRTHEKGHTQNGIDAARFLVTGIRELPPAGDCDTAGARANQKANEELELARARDAEYDEETQHGARQGATFR